MELSSGEIMKKIQWIFSFAVAVLQLLSPCANAEWAKSERETLKGIESLYVTIEKLQHDAVEVGLTSNMLRKDVELKLSTAGIKVPFALTGNDEPHLNLIINVYYDKLNNFVFYNFQISLLQPTILLRNSNLSCYARTWFLSTIGSVSKEECVKLIRDEIKNKIDTFINDYLAVNPKKP